MESAVLTGGKYIGLVCVGGGGSCIHALAEKRGIYMKQNHMQLLNMPPGGIYFISQALHMHIKKIYLVSFCVCIFLLSCISLWGLNVCGLRSVQTHYLDAHGGFRSAVIPESHSRTAPNAGRCVAGATGAECSSPQSSAPWPPVPPESSWWEP